MVKNKNANKDEVQVLTGNHLTVTTYPNGKVNLSWDWDALTRDVVAATTGTTTNLVAATEAKLKKTRKKKTD